MPEPQAFLNGRYIPASEAVVPVYDAGFVQGTTVAEQLRTFNGRLFRVEAHLKRLAHSLEIVGVDPGISSVELGAVAEELVQRNHVLLPSGDDLGLAMIVTPGNYATLAPDVPDRPLVCVHTYRLPFHFFAAKYDAGESLHTTSVRQVPADCWPPALKCRSRMHYYLADREARRREPGARALMLDADGMVTEASTANLVVYVERHGFLTPPHEKVLWGISISTLADLARGLGIAVVERDLSPDDVAAADEVLLTSTSSCILPVVKFNGRPIGKHHPPGTPSGQTGPIFRSLLKAWSQHVGLDIADQARKFSRR